MTFLADKSKGTRLLESNTTYDATYATTEDYTIYLDPTTGDDDNDGTSGNPVQTWNRVQELIPKNVNHTITVDCDDDLTYTNLGDWEGYYGSGKIIINGNVITPANCKSSGLSAGGYAMFIKQCSILIQIQGFTFDDVDAVGSKCIWLDNATNLYLYYVNITDYATGLYLDNNSYCKYEFCDIGSCATYGLYAIGGSRFLEIAGKSTAVNGTAYYLDYGCIGHRNDISPSYPGLTGTNFRSISDDCRIFDEGGTEWGNGWKKFVTSASMIDGNTLGLTDATKGFGKILIGDGEEDVYFKWTTSGVVTLINNSTNVIDSDTAGKFCVYDNGTQVNVKNNLGAEKSVAFDLMYNV